MSSQDRDAASRKIGDQVFKSMVSLGLEEARNAMYQGSNVAQSSTEPGMWGDRNYGDVAMDRAAGERDSPLTEMIRQAETAREQREPPEIVQE